MAIGRQVLRDGAALLLLAVSSAGCGHGAVPTLGRPWAPSGQQGYGESKPREIFNGGDPTGRVTDIHWRSWGGAKAVGTGTGWYVGPNDYVAGGHYEPATVVAFDLGSCHGRRAYRAIEWYFPKFGDHFNPHGYINACTGDYVGP